MLDVTEIDTRWWGDGGLVATASNSFAASAGRSLYVPLFASPHPSALAPFPSSAAEARAYFFDQSQHGARFDRSSTGRARPLARRTWPGRSPPLTQHRHPRRLRRAAQRRYTVTVNVGLYGDQVDDAYGVSFIDELLTYTVEVLPASAS